MEKRAKTSLLFAIAAVATLLLLFAALLLLFFLPLEVSRNFFDFFSPSGRLQGLDQARMAEIRRNFLFIFAFLGTFNILFLLLLRWREKAIINFFNLKEARSDYQKLMELCKDYFVANRIYIGGFIILLLFAVLIRIYYLFQPIRHDEAYTVLYFASRNLFYVMSHYDQPNNHILHTTLVLLIQKIFGESEWAIRLPACFFGILMVPACFALANLLFDRYAALLSSCLIASSSIFIEFSTNARGYTLLCFLSLTMFAAGLFLIQTRNLFVWLIFVGSAILGFYTMPIMFFSWGALLLWLIMAHFKKDLVQNEEQHFFNDLLAATAFICYGAFLLYSPVFLIAGPEAVFGNSWVQPKPFKDFLVHLPGFLHSAFALWMRDIPEPIVLILNGGFLFLCIFCFQRQKKSILFLATVVVWCLVLLFGLRIVFFSRLWLFLLPLFFIFASAGIVELFKKINSRLLRSRVFITTIMVFSVFLSFLVIKNQSILASPETGTFPEGQEIVSFLKEYLQPHDVVAAKPPSDFIIKYYWRRQGLGDAPFVINMKLFHRLVVVVCKEANKNIDEVLNYRYPLSLAPNASPEKIQEYKTAVLYTIKRSELIMK